MGLAKIQRCSDQEEHDSHFYDKRVTKTCSGLSACGMRLHPAHQYSEVVQEFCMGVCKCGLRNSLHGPGAHK